MKRVLCYILATIFALLIPGSTMVGAVENDSMSYTDKHLAADDNLFTPSIETTIGRGTAGNNNYCAQSFVATEDYVTGCRLHFRLGDNATMTIQLRSSLDDSDQSILYSGSYPLVSEPHNIHGWWDFEFTRGVKTEKGKTYYLVFWCDVWHSHCQVSTTRYVTNNLVNASYRKQETSSEWIELNRRSFGYELMSEPGVSLEGYPYSLDDNTMMLHDAEEYYCFNRKADNTSLAINTLNTTQGYSGMKLTGGSADAQGNLISAYVDFDTTTDLTAYTYVYVDLFASQPISQELLLHLSLLDQAGKNGETYAVPLQGYTKGWHRIVVKRSSAQLIGTGALTKTAQLAVQISGEAFPENLYFCVDNMRAAKKEAPTVTSQYYSQQELDAWLDDGSAADVYYVGKPGTTNLAHFGDVLADEQINSVDALTVLLCAVAKQDPTGQQYKAGDVNGDNALNATDALLILQYAVQKINQFPVEKVQEDIPPISDDFHISTKGLSSQTLYQITTSNLTQMPGGTMAHDIVRLAASLQGLLNRDLKENRIGLVIEDSYSNNWISYLQENDSILDGMAVETIPSATRFFSIFEEQFKSCGMVLWDPKVPSTANVAATICGIQGYLPVKYDTSANSVYQKLVEMGVPVKFSLVDKFTGKGLIPNTELLSTGSKKCDPYLWALVHYSAYCSPTYLVYVPDGASATKGNIIYENDVHSKSIDYNKLLNHDYGIYRKAFFFDLTAVDIEVPCDDPTQPLGTDRTTLQTILTNRYYRANGAFGEVVGFPPWQLKYATHDGWGSLDATTVEATFTEEVTKFNCYLDADGSLANCSIYTQFTLEDSYQSVANNKPVTEKFDPNTMYLYMYTGDYDSSPWALAHMYRCYNDPARGSIPITWSFTPGLANRIPMFFDYLYKNQTDMDYFSAADSGVGYVRPQGLFQSESDRTLPDGDKAFIKINQEWFRRFDLDSVGFVIGKLSPKACNTFTQFAPVGCGTNDRTWTPAVYNGTPYVRIQNGIGDPATTPEAMETTVSGMYEFATQMRKYNAASFRTVKFTASELKKTQEAFITYAAEKDPNTTYKFVDYKTYFAMIKEAGNGRYTLD